MKAATEIQHFATLHPVLWCLNFLTFCLTAPVFHAYTEPIVKLFTLWFLGKMKGLAFIQDPDGYWIEILCSDNLVKLTK